MLVLALPRRECVRDTGMLRLRGRAFGQQVGSDTVLAGDFEIDRLDACEPTYLLAVDDDREVVGTVRLLPTIGPTLVSEDLVTDMRLPARPDVVEASRLCIDAERAPTVGPRGVRYATSVLLAGLVEWGLTQGVTRVVGVLDRAMERVLSRAGWPAQRLAEPLEIRPGHPAVLVQLTVDGTALAGVREAGGLTTSVLAAGG